MMRRAKRLLSGCRKNARRASAVLWFYSVRASAPCFDAVPRKLRSRTLRGKKQSAGGSRR